MTHRISRRTVLGAMAAAPLAAQGRGSVPCLHRAGFTPPPEPPPWQPSGRPDTHVVDPDGWTPIWSGGAKRPDSQYPLLRALEDGQGIPGGPVVLVTGDIPGPQPSQIGGGDPGSPPYQAHWGAQPMEFEVHGQEYVTTVPGFELYSNVAGAPTGGVRRATVRDTMISPSPGDPTFCVRSRPGQDQLMSDGTWGVLRLSHTRLSGVGSDPVNGLRSYGRMAYELRNVTVNIVTGDGVLLASPQPDAWGGTIIERLIVGRAGFTALRVVNQKTANPGPSGSGHLLIDGPILMNGVWTMDGDLVVAGHLGPITVRNPILLMSRSGGVSIGREDSTGAYLDDGWANGDVVIDGLSVNCPAGALPACKVWSAKTVTVGEFCVQTPMDAHDFVAHGANGGVAFDLPGKHIHKYGGWQQGGAKVVMGAPLSNKAIDALACRGRR